MTQKTPTNDELTKNITGWLHALLESGRVNVTTDQVEYVVECKAWLKSVNNDEKIVLLAADVVSPVDISDT